MTKKILYIGRKGCLNTKSAEILMLEAQRTGKPIVTAVQKGANKSRQYKLILTKFKRSEG